MADEDEISSTPRPEKPSPNRHPAQKSPSMPRSGFGETSSKSPLSRNLQSAEEFISSVAAKIAAQPLQYSDPDVWGVLTAISEKARKRNQVSSFSVVWLYHASWKFMPDSDYKSLLIYQLLCISVFHLRYSSKRLCFPHFKITLTCDLLKIGITCN